MENATKALLIAAAILIAIVLIALGVKVLGSSKVASDQSEAVRTQMNDSVNETIKSLTGDLDNL